MTRTGLGSAIDSYALLNQKLWIAERQAKRGFKLFIYKYQAYPLQLFPLEPKVRFKNKYSLCLQKLTRLLVYDSFKHGFQHKRKKTLKPDLYALILNARP